VVPEFDVLTDDDRRLRVYQEGTGPGLVLCHGGPGLADYLGPLAALLADRACCVRWDQRGSGRSDRVGPFTIERFVADLDQVITATGGEPVALVGHSWGATLALHYTLAHPERVRTLVYVSGTGTGESWKPQWLRTVEARLPEPVRQRIADLADRARTPDEDRRLAVLRWSAEFADRSRAPRLAAELATHWSPVNHECNRVLAAEADGWDEQDLLRRCRELTVPALIVDGDADPRPRWAVDPLHDALPVATRVTIPDTGHLPWMEAPDRVREILIDHLDRLDALALTP
jgi:proline iminopeptidase